MIFANKIHTNISITINMELITINMTIDNENNGKYVTYSQKNTNNPY